MLEVPSSHTYSTNEHGDPRIETSADLIVYPFMAECVRDPNVRNSTFRCAQERDASRFTPHVLR